MIRATVYRDGLLTKPVFTVNLNDGEYETRNIFLLHVGEEMRLAKLTGQKAEASVYILNNGPWPAIGDFRVETHSWVETSIYPSRIKPGQAAACGFLFNAAEHLRKTGSHILAFTLTIADPSFKATPPGGEVERKWWTGELDYGSLTAAEKEIVDLLEEQDKLVYETFLREQRSRFLKDYPGCELMSLKQLEELPKSRVVERHLVFTDANGEDFFMVKLQEKTGRRLKKQNV